MMFSKINPKRQAEIDRLLIQKEKEMDESEDNKQISMLSIILILEIMLILINIFYVIS